jgi:hypothetical protein
MNKNKTPWLIIMHDPDIVESNKDTLDEKSKMYETQKEFGSRAEATKWVMEHIEILELEIKIHPEQAETCDKCGGQIMCGYGTNKPIYFTEEPENGLCSCWE